MFKAPLPRFYCIAMIAFIQLLADSLSSPIFGEPSFIAPPGRRKLGTTLIFSSINVYKNATYIKNWQWTFSKPLFYTILLGISKFQAWQSPWQTPRKCFWKGEFSIPGHKANRSVGAAKLWYGPIHGAIIFKKPANRHQLEIMKTVLNC